MNINKNLQKISLALFMGFSTCLVTAQVTQVSKIMAQYEDAFFNKIEEISDNYNKKVNYLNAQYMDRLHRDIIAMKSRGALYEVKAAQDEIARFGKDNQLLAKNVNKEFDSLKQVQLACIAKMDQVNYEKSKEIVCIYSRVIDALNRDKDLLTKNGDVNDALWVDEKRKEFEGSRAFKQAQTSVNIYELTHTIEKQVEESTPEVADTPQQQPQQNMTAAQDEVEAAKPLDPAIYGALKIDHSKTYPQGHIKEYKRLGLNSRTDVNSSAVALTAYEKDLSPDERGNWQWAKKIRFQINSNTSRRDYYNTFMVVRYFGSNRPSGTTSNINGFGIRAAPRTTIITEIGWQIIMIPEPLTNSRMFLDFPAFPEIEAEPWNSTSSLLSRTIDQYNFFGIIVSVYDADNNLIYQKASNDGLSPYARPKPHISIKAIRNPQNFRIVTQPQL